MSGGRLQLEPTLVYRIMLTDKFPTYIVPQIGVVSRLDLQTRTTNGAVIPDTSCIARGGPCKVETTTNRETSVTPAILPALGVSFMLPGAAIGYQAHIDVLDPSKTTHQVFLGFEF